MHKIDYERLHKIADEAFANWLRDPDDDRANAHAQTFALCLIADELDSIRRDGVG